MLLVGTRKERTLARTILIVDDDAAVARLYAEALTAEGLRVIVERDAEGALARVTEGGIDAVVLDALLPGTSGFELAEQLRRHPRGSGLPILFVSGVYKAARHRADVVDQFGAIDFLEKPVTGAEIALHLNQALGPADPEAPSAPTPALISALSATGFLRGDLADRPFHELFAQFVRDRSTGVLSLRREKVKKLISFLDGNPIGVKSNLLAECLGRVMVGAGLLSEAHCAQSLASMRATGRLQGQLLIEHGCIDARGLEEALQLQLETKLYDVFAWDSGDFQFAARAPDDSPTAGLGRPAARVLQEGLARARTDTALRALLHEGDEQAPNAAPAALEAFRSNDASDGVVQLVAAADGSRTIAELLEAHTVPRSHGLALFVALRELGLATFAPPAQAAPIPLTRRSAPPIALRQLVDPQDHLALQKLSRHLAELERATHYEVLGIPRAAALGEVRRAYLDLAREHHPDKHYAQSALELRETAGRLFARITQAHEILSDPDERGRYDQDTEESAADIAERILRADEAFRAARAAADATRWEEAADGFREAVALYPDDAVFHAWLGLALFQAHGEAPGASDRALAHLAEATRLHPRLAEAPLFAAHVRRALGDEALALEDDARARALFGAATR